jgi:hypothetical protein
MLVTFSSSVLICRANGMNGRRRSKLQGCIIGLREHDATEIFDAHMPSPWAGRLVGTLSKSTLLTARSTASAISMASSASRALRRTDRRGMSSLNMPATQAVRSGVPSDGMRMVWKDAGRHPWAAQLLTRKPAKIATVTFANKTERIA